MRRGGPKGWGIHGKDVINWNGVLGHVCSAAERKGPAADDVEYVSERTGCLSLAGPSDSLPAPSVCSGTREDTPDLRLERDEIDCIKLHCSASYESFRGRL